MPMISGYTQPLRMSTQALTFAGKKTKDPKQLAREAAAHYDIPRNKKAWRQQLEQAEKNILAKRREANGKPGFVMLDVDDTVLNYAPLYAEVTIGVNPQGEFVLEHGEGKGLRKVFAEGNPKPFGETLDFIQWLNANQIPYCFLSGRVEPYRQKMEQLLTNTMVMGKDAPQCFGLFLRQTDSSLKAADFKTQMRNQLEQAHGELWATVGDQPGDMVANPQDPRVNVLLPNYFPIESRASSQVH